MQSSVDIFSCFCSIRYVFVCENLFIHSIYDYFHRMRAHLSDINGFVYIITENPFRYYVSVNASIILFAPRTVSTALCFHFEFWNYFLLAGISAKFLKFAFQIRFRREWERKRERETWWSLHIAICADYLHWNGNKSRIDFFYLCWFKIEQKKITI